MNPAETYETAVFDFIRDLLEGEATEFQADLSEFVTQIADAGFVNSLAQALLKITLPGVPDFYQGTELWDFNLVDPDNRRSIDFAERGRRLDHLLAGANESFEQTARDVSSRWPDPDVKLWVIARALSARRDAPDVFSYGEYLPVAAAGPAAEHVVSFAKRLDEQCVVVVVPRHVQRLHNGQRQADHGTPRAGWHGTQLILPEADARVWRCEISGRTFESLQSGEHAVLDVGELFGVLPVALLTLQSN
jgi:(1->4)-alpha-D-glucan 1-alpha-D-glucosylmutase